MTVLEQKPLTLSIPLREEPAGVLRVGKSRVLLELVIHAHQRGAAPREIVATYDALDLGDVFAGPLGASGCLAHAQGQMAYPVIYCARTRSRFCHVKAEIDEYLVVFSSTSSSLARSRTVIPRRRAARMRRRRQWRKTGTSSCMGVVISCWLSVVNCRISCQQRSSGFHELSSKAPAACRRAFRLPLKCLEFHEEWVDILVASPKSLTSSKNLRQILRCKA